MKTILLLEDEPHLMKLLRQVLKQYELLVAASAEEAGERFEENGRIVDLLIADISLPKSSGIEVALLLRSGLPGLPIILTSGYPVSGWNDRDTADLEKLGRLTVTYLSKPFMPQALLTVVGELLEKRHSQSAGGI